MGVQLSDHGNNHFSSIMNLHGEQIHQYVAVYIYIYTKGRVSKGDRATERESTIQVPSINNQLF